MHSPALYHRLNYMQRRDAKHVLDEFADRIQWRPDGRDRLIDIGCGPGNVLLDYVHPLLPKDFDQLVGADISPEMVDFARETYAHVDRTSFRILDIGAESDLLGSFDHVTSFYCLNHVPDLKKAVSNIYDLLRDTGGDCLLVFAISNTGYDVYGGLHDHSKWGQYMQDHFISSLNSSDDPAEDLRSMVTRAGFVYYTIDIRHDVYVHEGDQQFRDFARSLLPCFERMPEELHESFLDDFLDELLKLRVREYVPEKKDYRFTIPYKFGLVYARKVGRRVKCD